MAEGCGRSLTETKGPVRVTLVSACYKEVGHCGNPYMGNCTGYSREKNLCVGFNLGRNRADPFGKPASEMWQVIPNGGESMFITSERKLLTLKNGQTPILT